MFPAEPDCGAYLCGSLVACNMYRCLPVSEYFSPVVFSDEPDRELICVGHWLEDMKSYLITYDEEDAVSQFRCWVSDKYRVLTKFG